MYTVKVKNKTGLKGTSVVSDGKDRANWSTGAAPEPGDGNRLLDPSIRGRSAEWRYLGDECKKYAIEEAEIMRTARSERLTADCSIDPKDPFGDESILNLRDGPDECLKLRFEVWAKKAGIALGCPQDKSPVKFWLGRLFQYLVETNGKYLYAPSHTRVGSDPKTESLKPHTSREMSGGAGYILNVWGASAIFCDSLEAQPSPPGVVPEFKHSEDFRTINWKGCPYTLTPSQAQVIKVLYEGFKHGMPCIGKEIILENLDSRNRRLQDTFRKSGLWMKLIIQCSKRGTYRLNI